MNRRNAELRPYIFPDVQRKTRKKNIKLNNIERTHVAYTCN